jgi:hypothetical protein
MVVFDAIEIYCRHNVYLKLLAIFRRCALPHHKLGLSVVKIVKSRTVNLGIACDTGLLHNHNLAGVAVINYGWCPGELSWVATLHQANYYSRCVGASDTTCGSKYDFLNR